MGHYGKLAVLGIRTFGLVILLYAVPMTLWGFFRVGMGVRVASDGRTSETSALLGWILYALAGLLLLLLARPLGRVAARGLDEPVA